MNRSRELSRATARYFISKAPLPVAAQFEQLPSTGVGGRCGGDEFAILAPNTPESALPLGECIPGPVSRTVQHSRVTASIGDRGIRVARSPEDVGTSDLIALADKARYAAKLRTEIVSACHRRFMTRLPVGERCQA